MVNGDTGKRILVKWHRKDQYWQFQERMLKEKLELTKLFFLWNFRYKKSVIQKVAVSVGVDGFLKLIKFILREVLGSQQNWMGNTEFQGAPCPHTAHISPLSTSCITVEL